MKQRYRRPIINQQALVWTGEALPRSAPTSEGRKHAEELRAMIFAAPQRPSFTPVEKAAFKVEREEGNQS